MLEGRKTPTPLVINKLPWKDSVTVLLLQPHSFFPACLIFYTLYSCRSFLGSFFSPAFLLGLSCHCCFFHLFTAQWSRTVTELGCLDWMGSNPDLMLCCLDLVLPLFVSQCDFVILTKKFSFLKKRKCHEMIGKVKPQYFVYCPGQLFLGSKETKVWISMEQTVVVDLPSSSHLLYIHGTLMLHR